MFYLAISNWVFYMLFYSYVYLIGEIECLAISLRKLSFIDSPYLNYFYFNNFFCSAAYYWDSFNLAYSSSRRTRV